MTTPNVDTAQLPVEPNATVKKLNEKKKAEIFWKIILFVVSIVSAILLKNVYVFQTHDFFKDIRKGSIVELGTWGVLIAIVFYLIEKNVKAGLSKFIRQKWIRQDKYLQEGSRARRIDLMAKWVYTIPYYFFNSIFAYILLKDTDVLPVWLGGSGQCSNLYMHTPNVVGETFGMKVFYMIGFGRSLSHFVSHFFNKNQGNFYEYALHHGLTTFLVFFSYLTNYWTAGIFIQMIHDQSDAALSLARFYGDYKYKKAWVVHIIYVWTVISWIGCRIIIHTGCCVFPVPATVNAFIGGLLSQFQLSVILTPGLFMATMVVLLQILNIFWTYFIFSVFFVTSVNKKAKISVYEN